MDKLIVNGLGKPLDGEYEFDLGDILGIGTPGGLTNREAHRIKTMSGVRIGELEDALAAGDNDVFVALAAVILSRSGKVVDEAKLWDAPLASALRFELGEPEEAEDGPPVEPATTPGTETPSTSGGKSSNTTSENQESDQSPTGLPGSETSVTSPPVSLVS